MGGGIAPGGGGGVMPGIAKVAIGVPTSATLFSQEAVHVFVRYLVTYSSPISDVDLYLAHEFRPDMHPRLNL